MPKHLSYFEKRDDDKNSSLPIRIALTSQVTQRDLHLEMKNPWMVQWVQTKGFWHSALHGKQAFLIKMPPSFYILHLQTPGTIGALGQEHSNRIVSKFTQAKYTQTTRFSVLITYLFPSSKKGKLLVSSQLSPANSATPAAAFSTACSKESVTPFFLYYLKESLP